jgi:hypothetical protein
LAAADFAMAGSTEDVKNWMNMFRWIVKLIRDDYGVAESRLTRTAILEQLGLSHEQIEEIVATIARSFGVRFPDHALDEIVKLEELCLVASWLKGLYKRPDFISPHFERKCRAANPSVAV